MTQGYSKAGTVVWIALGALAVHAVYSAYQLSEMRRAMNELRDAVVALQGLPMEHVKLREKLTVVSNKVDTAHFRSRGTPENESVGSSEVAPAEAQEPEVGLLAKEAFATLAGFRPTFFEDLDGFVDVPGATDEMVFYHVYPDYYFKLRARDLDNEWVTIEGSREITEFVLDYFDYEARKLEWQGRYALAQVEQGRADLVYRKDEAVRVLNESARSGSPRVLLRVPNGYVLMPNEGYAKMLEHPEWLGLKSESEIVQDLPMSELGLSALYLSGVDPD